MSNPAKDGVHLTKEYYKDFLPTDMQWGVTHIDDDFTLYDLFRLVYCAQHMIPDIFTTMGMPEFESFWKQIQLDREIGDSDYLEYLELYWSPWYETKITDKTGKHTDQQNSCLRIDKNKNYWDAPQIAGLSNLMAMHGIGSGCPEKDLDYHECGDDCPETTGYAVEFTPLNNLAHLPIRVLPSVEFYPPYVECDREYHETGFELKIEPTLWCFITSIFWELTFIGSTPDIVADRKEELVDDIEEYKNDIKETEYDGEDHLLDG